MPKHPQLTVQTTLVSEQIDKMLSNLHEFQIKMFSPVGELISSPAWEEIFKTILEDNECPFPMVKS